MKVCCTWVDRSAAVVLAIALLMCSVCGCGGSSPSASISAEKPADPAGTASSAAASSATLTSTSTESNADGSIAPQKNLYPEVVIKTSAGDIHIRLNADKAPVTVDNFLENYVDRGFYDDTIFHHVDPNYILAGGYHSDLQPQEVRAPIRNEAMNGLKNTRGTITMSRVPEYADSATAEFFINVTAAPSLDYDEADGNDGYCVFGKVVRGMEVVDKIAQSEVHQSGDFPQVPVEAISIHSIQRVD